MIRISIKQLQNLHACEGGIEWFRNQKRRSMKLVVDALLKDNHFDYARWLFSKLLTKEQNVLWSIYSAEQSLDIFEKAFLRDNRPRLAIQAAKDLIVGKGSTEAAWAAEAAARAARAAAWAATEAAWAAEAAAWAAEAAARATEAATWAARAARAAAWAATEAAWAAAWAAGAAAWAARAAEAATEKDLCNYALKLLGEIK